VQQAVRVQEDGEARVHGEQLRRRIPFERAGFLLGSAGRAARRPFFRRAVASVAAAAPVAAMAPRAGHGHVLSLDDHLAAAQRRGVRAVESMTA